MKKIVYALAFMWCSASYAQETHVNPEALMLRDYKDNTNETLCSFFVQTKLKKDSRIMLNLHMRASADDTSNWWTAMVGPSIRIGEGFKIGALGGYETYQNSFRGAVWLSLTSKNERFKAFALYEAGRSKWWSKFETFYRLNKEEHAFEVQAGVLGHESRFGPCVELEYRRTYLILTPYMYNFDDAEHPGGLIALGARIR